MKPARAMVHVSVAGMLACLLLSWSCRPMSPALADGTDDDLTALAADAGLSDKDVHRTASLALGASLYSGQVWARDLRSERQIREGGGYPVLSSLLVCLAVGRAKEQFDARVDPADLQANAEGCAIGVLTSAIVDDQTWTIAPEIDVGEVADPDRLALTLSGRF